MANQIKEAFEAFPYWRVSEKHEREVTKKMYKILLDAEIDNFIDITKKIMNILIGKAR